MNKNWMRWGLWGSLALMLVLHFTIDYFNNPGDFTLFLGRFHPVVLHLPIGILILTLVLELATRFSDAKQLDQAVPITLYLGAVTGAAASMAGLLLSTSGGYDADVLWWHKRLGMGMALMAGIAYVIRSKERSAVMQKVYLGSLAVITVMLFWGSHLGGTVTHGAGYLTRYMPDPMRAVAGLPSKAELAGPVIDNIEEAAIYESLVQPIFNDKCTSCHNDDNKRGGLDLTSADVMLEGGDTGEVFMPGASDESELVRRLWLPLSHDDHMPPEGKPQMTIAEAELVRWWIDQGGSFELTLAEAEITPQVQQVLDGLGLEERKTGIFALEVAPPDSNAMMALGEQGISVMGLAEDVPFVQVHCTNALDSMSDEQMSLLEPLAEQIAWLNLGRTGITDAGLDVVAGMPHLTRLHLENTQVTDAALEHLKDLQYLEYLNLYGTQVTDEGIQQLSTLPRLRSLYLWQTQVTEAGAEQLQQAIPNLEINLGWEQAPVQTAADEEEEEEPTP